MNKLGQHLGSQRQLSTAGNFTAQPSPGLLVAGSFPDFGMNKEA
jgi:hypothetical protein